MMGFEMTDPGGHCRRGLRCWFGEHWRSLLWIVLISALAHLAIFMLYPQFLGLDSASYIAPAQALARGHGFTDLNGLPETDRTPGYPLFLALFVQMGIGWGGVVMVQHLVMIGLALALYAFAARSTGDRMLALWAAILFSIDLPTLVAANRIYTEWLHALILLAVCWCAFEAVRVTSLPWRWALASAAGLLGGVNALVRPVGVLYFVPLALFLLIVLRRAAVGLCAVCVAVFLIAPGCWMARNYRETGVPTFSSIAGVNMLLYRATGVLEIEEAGILGPLSGGFSKRQHVPEAGTSLMTNQRSIQDRLAAAAAAEVKATTGRDVSSLNKAELSRVYEVVGWRIVRQHPLAAAMLFAKGLANMMLGGSAYELTAITGMDGRLAIVLVGLWSVLYLIAACLGFWALYRSGTRPARILFALAMLTICYYVMVSVGAESDSRFRVPFTPLWTMVVAAGALNVARDARGKAAVWGRKPVEQAGCTLVEL